MCAISLHVRKQGPGIYQDSRAYGAGNEARTRYLHLGKVALYQMSYARASERLRSVSFRPAAKTSHPLNRSSFPHKNASRFRGDPVFLI